MTHYTVCPYCKKEFPRWYWGWKKRHLGSVKMPGLAKANYYRHETACRDKKAISFATLKHMSAINSKDLPMHIKFTIDKKTYYRMWTGIGWIEENRSDEAIEIIE